MAIKRVELIEAESHNPPPLTRAFLQSLQTALLLSLLEKKLLTQRQFDRCLEELNDKDD